MTNDTASPPSQASQLCESVGRDRIIFGLARGEIRRLRLVAATLDATLVVAAVLVGGRR